MAISKKSESKTGGGQKRGKLLIQTDGNIAVTTAAASAGTVTSDYQIPKNAWIRVRALDSNKAESATFVDILGRAVSDGADPSVVTIYLWTADGGGITFTANSYLLLEWQADEQVLSD
jgi:hypothetical protein